MKTDYKDLLPVNSTPLERSIAGPSGRLLAIPADIEKIWRSAVCPTNLLPWLAWSVSADFWDEQWTHQRQRAIINESFRIHFKKGTLYGIERYLTYADAELLRAIVPPDKAYPGRSMTREEREIWLSRFPQIRIYNYANRGVATKGAFTKGAFGLPKTFLGAGLEEATKPTVFPYQTDAWDRWGRRPFLWDQGTHPLATGEFSPMRWTARYKEDTGSIAYDFERLLVGTKKQQAVWLDANVKGNRDYKDGRLFLMKSTASRRVVTVTIEEPYNAEQDVLEKKFAVYPSLDPVHVTPDLVFERGTSRRGFHIFAGVEGSWINYETRERRKINTFLLGYLPPTTSRYRIYDRLALHDKERLPDRRPPTFHLGYMRLGMPAYHATLSVAIRDKKPFKSVGRYVHGHLYKSSLRPLHNARMAILSASAERDKIGIQTTLHTAVAVSPKTKVGSNTRVGRAYLLLR